MIGSSGRVKANGTPLERSNLADTKVGMWGSLKRRLGILIKRCMTISLGCTLGRKLGRLSLGQVRYAPSVLRSYGSHWHS